LRASEQLRATLFTGHEEQRVPLAGLLRRHGRACARHLALDHAQGLRLSGLEASPGNTVSPAFGELRARHQALAGVDRFGPSSSRGTASSRGSPGTNPSPAGSSLLTSRLRARESRRFCGIFWLSSLNGSRCACSSGRERRCRCFDPHGGRCEGCASASARERGSAARSISRSGRFTATTRRSRTDSDFRWAAATSSPTSEQSRL
jgi:hypothetical protein